MRDNMGDHSHGSPDDSGTVAKAGTGTLDKFQDPGLPPHRKRLADTDPRAEKRAERQVALLFIISIIGTLSFFIAYFVLGRPDNISEIRVQNSMLGLGTTFAMLGIGIGIVHWAKTLMPDHEVSEMRHEIRPEADRQDAEDIINQVIEETGIKRRPLIRNTLIGAIALAPVPAIFMFRDLEGSGKTAGQLIEQLRHTMWDKDVRLTRDPSGTPIKASDVQIGSVFHVIPEGLNESEDPLNEKAKAVVLLMRLDPDEDEHLPRPRELARRRHRRLLEDLHPRGLPGCSLRAADAPPAVPVPPVDLRPHPASARLSSVRPVVRCHSCRSRLTPTASWSPKATSTSLLDRATGSVANP